MDTGQAVSSVLKLTSGYKISVYVRFSTEEDTDPNLGVYKLEVHLC